MVSPTPCGEPTIGPACSTLGLGSTRARKLNPRTCIRCQFVGGRGDLVTRRSAIRYKRRRRGRGRRRRECLLTHALAAGMFVADPSGALSLASGILVGAVRALADRQGAEGPSRITVTNESAMQGSISLYVEHWNEPERLRRGSFFARRVGAFPTSDDISHRGVDEKRWHHSARSVGIPHLERDPDYSDT